MDFVTFVYLYLSITAGLIFILLFGEAPQFSRTPLPWLHYLVTVGWAEGLEWVVKHTCGERGLRGLDAATECCCERSNPTLQIAYLTILSAGYYLYSTHFFAVLPNDTAAGYHVYTGTAAVCLCLATFIAASLSDPGRLTPTNAAAAALAYPPDGRLFKPQTCRTCKLPRPGRSKHCNSCSGCILRFDHHCGWVNNCVGLANTRTFLAFLAANLGLCLYGGLLAPQVMLGELARRGALDVWVRHPTTGRPVPLYTLPWKFAEWLLYYYPVHLAVEMFLVAAGAILAFFLAYQSWNICQGHTAYEVHKHRQLLKAARAAAGGDKGGGSNGGQQSTGNGLPEEAAAAAAAAAAGDRQVNSSSQQLSSHSGPSREQQGGADQGSGQQARDRSKRACAPYDRGVLLNWWEVMAPHSFMAWQQHRQELARGEGPQEKQKHS